MKSSPLKAEPSGYEPTTPEVRAALASLVNDSYQWFKSLVQQRRGMTDAELAAVDDGRVFTGRQALGLKLIDEIGGEREAIAWMDTPKGFRTAFPFAIGNRKAASNGWGFSALRPRLRTPWASRASPASSIAAQPMRRRNYLTVSYRFGRLARPIEKRATPWAGSGKVADKSNRLNVR